MTLRSSDGILYTEVIDMTNVTKLLKAFESAEGVDKYLLGKAIVDAITETIEPMKDDIMKNNSDGVYENDLAARKLVIKMETKTSYDTSAVVANLTEGELRKGFKVSDAVLKAVKRSDLIDKYKSTTQVRGMRVLQLKDKAEEK